MAGAPQDLAFVARMLGEAAVPGPDPVPEARSRRAVHMRWRKESNTAADPEDEQSRKAVLEKYSKPNKKGPKQWFCEACNCTTAARERDWDVHIRGIRHKRQLVSMMHTGQLGNTVLSLFEADPVQLLRQYDNTWQKFVADYPNDVPRLQKAKTEVLKALLNLDGNSMNTQRIAVHYQDGEFAAAWMSAAQKLGEQMQICPDDVQLTLTAPELVCVSQLMAGNKHVLSLTVHSQPGNLSSHTDPQPYALRHMEEAVAVSLLLKTCQSISCLRVLAFKCAANEFWDTPIGAIPLVGPGAAFPSADVSRLLKPVEFHLQNLLRNSLSLRTVSVRVTDHYTWSDKRDAFKAASREGQRNRRALVTRAVLLGTHSRLGARCYLRHLPNPLIRCIIYLAVPHERCAVFLHEQQCF